MDTDLSGNKSHPMIGPGRKSQSKKSLRCLHVDFVGSMSVTATMICSMPPFFLSYYPYTAIALNVSWS